MIYGLNRMISSADREMPGLKRIMKTFTFGQECAVGNNKGIYSQIGERVSMMSKSKILGNCNIGDRIIIVANSFALDTNIPSHLSVFGQKLNQVIKKTHLKNLMSSHYLCLRGRTLFWRNINEKCSNYYSAWWI